MKEYKIKEDIYEAEQVQSGAYEPDKGISNIGM